MTQPVVTEITYTQAAIDALLAAQNASISAVNAAVATKADAATLAAVATTGDYGSLTGKPTIPSTAAEVGAVPTTRLVNNKALSADISLTASDVLATPFALASGASALRIVGYGATLPASGTLGDCFFLQAP
jgi:hypothetical protein